MGQFLKLSAVLLLLSLAAIACAGEETNELRVLTPLESAEIIEDASPDLVVLDVRTPEEFAEGHIEGADMLDFYRADFADELAKLPRDAEYVIYCRSGNRSGQTLELMRELGFNDVVDVEGGILNWTASELPVTVP